MGHDAFQVPQHVAAVVDEMRDAQFAAVIGLLRSLEAEAQVGGRNARALEEAVVPQPGAALGLHARAAFRNQPDASLEPVHQRADRIEHAFIGRRAQRVVQRSADEGRVRAIGVLGRDQHAADVDAKAGKGVCIFHFFFLLS
ncbi:hypothetical protein D3C85_1226880 [compost metagenome]